MFSAWFPCPPRPAVHVRSEATGRQKTRITTVPGCAGLLWLMLRTSQGLAAGLLSYLQYYRGIVISLPASLAAQQVRLWHVIACWQVWGQGGHMLGLVQSGVRGVVGGGASQWMEGPGAC